jgi:hypothetical protein
MRPEDKKIFAEAASNLKLWILVRRTNPESLKYIGKPGFTPKRIDCKAKTADIGKAAGLVVDAEVHRLAFKPAKTESAMKAWRDFKATQLGRGGYSVDRKQGSPFYGCVTFNGRYIHGDYDLYDIIIPGQEQRNLAAVEELFGQPHRRGPRLYQVMEFVNTRIGAPMLQHGGEAQYADHSEQAIDAFGPDGEQCTILNEFSVRGWYQERFKGRQTLATPH